MRKWFFIALLLVGLSLLISGEVKAATSDIDVLTVDGTINPVLVGYIERGIDLAEEHGATACIIEMNTPGGLASSMQVIVERIINAEVPVVVYVSPGGWAASAGTFIAMSAHIAAMGPGSSIGAATPIAASGEELPETEEQKALEFFSSYMQTLAEQRGRNVEWAEEAVRESASLTDMEALEQNVIDLRANNMDHLISQLDGWQVTLLSGEVVTLNTLGANVNYIDMGAMERFLFTISDPNIAYILLSLGMMGLFFELSNPGAILPGVVGAICLLLAFYSLGMLPVNYAGVLLIVLAFGLFVAEVFVTGHGLLALGGIASFATGSMILMASPVFQINRGLIAVVVIVVAAVFVFAVGAIVRTHRVGQQTGREAMVGKVAVARTPLKPTGTVFVHGERWEATVNEGRVEPGEEVLITEVDGLKLRVTKKSKEGGE